MTAAEAHLTLLFADISGSTTLYEELGDGPALAAISICRCCMEQAVAGAGGQLVKSLGDGVMAAFLQAEEALNAASAMVEATASLPGRPSLRVGVHYGTVLAEGGDFFGDTVNVAARLMEQAQRGQVLTSLQTVQQLPPARRVHLRDLGPLQVKGRAEVINIYELARTPESTPIAPQAQPRTLQPTLLLNWGEGLCLAMNDGLPVISLGQDASCDIPLVGSEVSPSHARIEWQGEAYVLVDHSSAGTSLQYLGQAPVFLRHEEAVLQGMGRISLGSGDAAPSLHFRYIS